MNLSSDLPPAVIDVILSSLNAEFATVSAAGLPIDTPMLILPSPGLKTFDVCTGVAYPAKAERARNNPRVGLLFEGGPGEPIISVAGMAAVRDSDIQSNLNRYISETAYARPLNPSWSVARKAVYYWSRILIAITPKQILWWDNQDLMDQAPHVWNAPADTVYPASNPRPAGAASARPNWPEHRWQDLARQALGIGLPAHVTRCDAEGFPLPIRAGSVQQTDDGFTFDMPAGAPWDRNGAATLTFMGRETFVGTIEDAGGRSIRMTVERPLPINPFVNDPSELWAPSDTVYDTMMGRLRQELDRRGLPIPTLPEDEPELTEYAKIRRAKLGENFESSLPTE